MTKEKIRTHLENIFKEESDCKVRILPFIVWLFIIAVMTSVLSILLPKEWSLTATYVTPLILIALTIKPVVIFSMRRQES